MPYGSASTSVRTRVSICGMLTGSCFWKTQAFMQSLQIRWPVPAHIGLSTRDERERGDRVAGAPHHVHLGDLLVERTAAELDAERVLLDRAVLVAQALAARVLVALVAVEAVVDLLFDLARGAALVGEAEIAALASLFFGADEELGQLGLGPAELDEVLEIEVVRLAERGPPARLVVVILAALGEHELDRVERAGDRGVVLGGGRGGGALVGA